MNLKFARDPSRSPRSFDSGQVYDKAFLDADVARIQAKYSRAKENYQSNQAGGRLRDRSLPPGPGPHDINMERKRSLDRRAPAATGAEPLADFFAAGELQALSEPEIFKRMSVDCSRDG